MNSIAQNTVAKIAAVAMSLVLAFAFAAPALALTQAEATAIITALGLSGSQAAVIQALVTGSAPSSASSCTFTRDLTMGAKGADVTCLQQALIAAGYSIPAGATGYFGGQTQAAVKAWQTAAGVSPAAGYFGPKSRAAFNLGGGSSSGGSTSVPAGTGLTIAAGTQPANALSPQSATRVPFTRFTLTAGNDGDVVVSSVAVQRVGVGQDAAFAGVILIDEATGKQLGVARTFNSNHQANIGESMTIPRGTSKTFLVAGNMNSSLSSYAGEAPGIAVVGVNTTATVTGSMPITGAYNTNNATLTVGSMTISTSNAYASNSNQSKEIGTTGFKQTGIRLQAGSAEGIRLKGLRWNQTGSVSATDLANVVTYVNGTAYPTTVSADGKYFDTNFGSGVLIPKGNQVDVYVQYDIVGANSSGRTVIFDIDKNTDIFATGETYGFGVSPAAGSSSVPTSRGTLTITSGTPFVYSTQTSVTGASVTTIGKANEVAAQNIAINVPNQPLGGYVVDIKGENMTVQSTVITIASSSGSGNGLLTSITIVDENGAVVAGPVDATYTNSTTQTATFTDTITYKTGRHVFTIRGKVSSNIGGGTLYTVTTVPSSGWTTVRGETTGNTISLSSNGSFSMNVMTVKAGAMAIGRSASPASQNMTAGGQGVLMSNLQFDASNSGEDVRFSSVPMQLAIGGSAAATDLTACQFFDGATALNTGSSVLNPSSTATSTVTLDNPVTVTKGSVKTLGWKCNVSGSVSNGASYYWDIGAASTMTFTGATSGTSITGSDASDSAAVFTVQSGSAAVTTDATSPSYALVSAGSTDVTVGALKLRATNENVNLTKLGLQLTNTASSSSSDLVKVKIYNGATLVGEAFFAGSATTATSTFSSPLSLVKNTDVTLTLKAELNNIGVGEAVAFSGHLLAVDYLNGEGTGASSGTTVFTTGSSAVAGARVLKSFPVISADSLPSTGVADGRLGRFKVTADAKGPIGITNFALNLSTTTASVTNVTIYGFTDANYSSPVAGVSASGDLQATDDATVPGTGNVVVGITTSGGTATVIQVPAGGTRYFEIRGTVSGATSGASVTTKLLGSSAFPSTSAGVSANPLLAAGNVSTSEMVWSPNSTTTATRSDQDWTSGFGINGLPSGGLIFSRSQ